VYLNTYLTPKRNAHRPDRYRKDWQSCRVSTNAALLSLRIAHRNQSKASLPLTWGFLNLGARAYYPLVR
jgi:hypothetical protein